MTGIVGVLSKDNGQITERLIQMLKAISHRGFKQFSICIDGKPEIVDNLDEFDNVELKSTLGLGGCWVDVGNKDRGHISLDLGNFFIDGVINDLPDYFQSPNNFEASLRYLIERSETGFSIAGKIKDSLVLARDVIGLKPLYYGESDKYIAFASEKKALWSIGLAVNIRPVLPGEAIMIRKGILKKHNFRTGLANKIRTRGFNDCVGTIEKLLDDSVLKNVMNNEAVLLFSGGLDSSVLAQIFKNHDIELNLYCAGFKNCKDHLNAVRTAEKWNLPIQIIELTDDLIWSELENIVYQLESIDTVTTEIAAPLYFATGRARKDGFYQIFSGQGADELFGGYSRYEKEVQASGFPGLNDAIFDDVTNIWSKNLERDDKICMANSIELVVPYLDRRLVEFSLGIPMKIRLSENIF
jgi:asparagine synthase (glutamine-hydrolysing)